MKKIGILFYDESFVLVNKIKFYKLYYFRLTLEEFTNNFYYLFVKYFRLILF